MSRGRAENASAVTVFDLVSFVVGAIGFAFAIAAVVVLQPRYAQMFRDFGGELPGLTLLFLTPWVPLAAAAVAPAIVVAGIARGSSKRARALALVGCVLLTALAPALFFFAMNLPIFEVSVALP